MTEERGPEAPESAPSVPGQMGLSNTSTKCELTQFPRQMQGEQGTPQQPQVVAQQTVQGPRVVQAVPAITTAQFPAQAGAPAMFPQRVQTGQYAIPIQQPLMMMRPVQGYAPQQMTGVARVVPFPYNPQQPQQQPMRIAPVQQITITPQQAEQLRQMTPQQQQIFIQQQLALKQQQQQQQFQMQQAYHQQFYQSQYANLSPQQIQQLQMQQLQRQQLFLQQQQAHLQMQQQAQAQMAQRQQQQQQQQHQQQQQQQQAPQPKQIAKGPFISPNGLEFTQEEIQILIRGRRGRPSKAVLQIRAKHGLKPGAKLPFLQDEGLATTPATPTKKKKQREVEYNSDESEEEDEGNGDEEDEEDDDDEVVPAPDNADVNATRKEGYSLRPRKQMHFNLDDDDEFDEDEYEAPAPARKPRNSAQGTKSAQKQGQDGEAGENGSGNTKTPTNKVRRARNTDTSNPYSRKEGLVYYGDDEDDDEIFGDAASRDSGDEEEEEDRRNLVEKILLFRIVDRPVDPALAAEEREKEMQKKKSVAPPPPVQPKNETTADGEGEKATSESEKQPTTKETEETTRDEQSDVKETEEVKKEDAQTTETTKTEKEDAEEKNQEKMTNCERHKIVELFVKWKRKSFLHCSWITEEMLSESEKHIGVTKIRRFWKKLGIANSDEVLEKDYQNPLLFTSVQDILQSVGYGGSSSSCSPETTNPEDIADFLLAELTQVDRVIAASTLEELDGTKSPIYLVKWLGLPYTEASWEKPEDFRDDTKVEEYKRFHLMPTTPPPPPLPQRLWVRLDKSPEYKNGNRLRQYQLEGLNWLIFNWCQGRGCILADEMGLGKTVQVIAFFEHLRTVQLLPGPFLVIVPLSTLPHWEHALHEWTDMNVVVMTGSRDNREQIKRWEWFYLDDMGNIKSKQIKFHVLLTSYEVITSEWEDLSKIRWQVVVIDEAHRIKNSKCKMIQCMEMVKCYHRVLLTGTPVQNNTEELWSLLHYIDPANFADLEAFSAKYGNVREASQVAELQQILKVYLLRREKVDVEKSIPPKEETIVEVELSNMQKQYYRALIEHNREFLMKGTTGSNCPHLINLLMELRKVCDHPFLLRGVEERDLPPEAWKDPAVYQQALIRSSGKFVLLDKLLPNLYENGHKVLIFSQLKGVLDLLERYLKGKEYLYERLDGSIKANERAAAIDRFSNNDFNRFVFLLSTRAGGVGVNLTRADTVIIFDSDWNPQNDLQAQARCHRIGQKKEVKVYRLISKNTYEESMFDKASKKLGLDQAVLHNMNTAALASRTPTPSVSPDGAAAAAEQAKKTAIGLSKDEISRMLQHGAYALFHDDKENEKASALFSEEDIDQILERRSKRMVWMNDMQGSMFSKATFKYTEDAPDVDVNAPDFWEKVIPSAQTPKMLFDQFSKVVTSENDEKDDWVRNKKLSFMNNLSDLVSEVVRSFNDAKGVLPMDRDILKSILFLCTNNTALFSAAELKDLNKWLDDIDYGRRRRQSKPAADYVDLSEPPVTRTNPPGRRGRPRNNPLPGDAVGSVAGARRAGAGEDDALSDSSIDDDDDGDDGMRDDKDGDYGAPPAPKVAHRKRGRPRIYDVKKRLRSSGGDDGDEDYVAGGGADGNGDGEDSDFGSGNGEDDETYGDERRASVSKRNQVGKQRQGKGPWSSTERHLLQDAVFSIGRPDWSLILERARLAPRPAVEVQEIAIQLVKYVASRARDSASMELFMHMAEEFEGARMSEVPPYANGKKDKRTLAEIQSLVEVAPGDEKALFELIDKRLPGWTRRMNVLYGVRREVEHAAAKGTRPIEGLDSNFRLPASWWVREKHDSDIFTGIYRYGWGAWDNIIYDQTLSFYDTLKSRFPNNGDASAEGTDAPDATAAAATATATAASAVATGTEDAGKEEEGEEEAKNDGPTEAVISERKAKRARATIPSRGITFQTYLGWPGLRTLEHYVQNLIAFADKMHRKALKKAKKEERRRERAERKAAKKHHHKKHHKSSHKEHRDDNKESETECSSTSSSSSSSSESGDSDVSDFEHEAASGDESSEKK